MSVFLFVFSAFFCGESWRIIEAGKADEGAGAVGLLFDSTDEIGAGADADDLTGFWDPVRGQRISGSRWFGCDGWLVHNVSRMHCMTSGCRVEGKGGVPF